MSRERRKRPARETAKDYSPALGKTIQRLRKAYKLSLGELSEQSGVAKSIISQIERNETNPTLGTVWRLTRALDTTVDEVLKTDGHPNILEHAKRAAVPILTSQDGLCTLSIIGALDLVEFLQWYDFKAKPGGILESEPHQAGCIEHLSVLDGELEVTVEGESKIVRAGETLRYRGDKEHSIRNTGSIDAHATMVDLMRVTVVD
jgi:transcriptional regulator with XRE-family HTH domain